MSKNQERRANERRRRQRQRRRKADRGHPLLALLAAGLVTGIGVFAGLLATGTITLFESGATETVETAASQPESNPAPTAEPSPVPTEPPTPEPTATPTPEPSPTPDLNRDPSEPLTTTVIEGGIALEPTPTPPPTVEPPPTPIPEPAAPEDVAQAQTTQPVPSDSQPPEPTGPGSGSVVVSCSDDLSNGLDRLAIITWQASNPGSSSAPIAVSLGGVEVASAVLGGGESTSGVITLPDASSVSKKAVVSVNGVVKASASVPWC